MANPVGGARSADDQKKGERQQPSHALRFAAHRNLDAFAGRRTLLRRPNARLLHAVGSDDGLSGLARDMDLDVRSFRAQPDDVAVVEWLVTRYAPAIHEGAVRAAAVTNAIAGCCTAEDFGVTRRDVEIGIRVEAEIRLQM